MMLAEMGHHPSCQNRRSEKGEERLDLLIHEDRAKPSLQHLHVKNEGDRAQNHEQDCDPFNTRIGEMPDRAVLGRKPARRHRRHRVDHRIIRSHTDRHVGDGADAGDADEDERDRGRDLGRPGQDLLRRVKGLCLEQLHTTDLQHRQNRNRHHDDPEPAQPLQQPAPEQQPGRGGIEAGDHRRSGCGQAGHRFKEGIGVARHDARPLKRQRTERHQRQPRNHRHQHRLPGRQTLWRAPVGDEQPEAEKHRYHRRTCEDHPVVIVGSKIHKRRQKHGDAQRRHQRSGH
jgi:hypothetical protein